MSARKAWLTRLVSRSMVCCLGKHRPEGTGDAGEARRQKCLAISQGKHRWGQPPWKRGESPGGSVPQDFLPQTGKAA
jgi:hypothetical protein